MTRFSIASLSLCLMLAASSSIFSCDSDDVGDRSIKAPRIIPVEELLEGLGLSVISASLSGGESEDDGHSQGVTSEIPQRRFNFSFPNKPFQEMTGEDWGNFNNLLVEYRQEAAELSRECVNSIQEASAFQVNNRLVSSTGVRRGRVVETKKLQQSKVFDKEKLMKALSFAFDKLYDYTKKIDQVTGAIRGDLLGAAEIDFICTGLNDVRCIPLSEEFDFVVGSESVKTKELLQDGEKCVRILKRVWQLVFVKHFYHKVLYHNVTQGFASYALSQYLHDNPGLAPQQLYDQIEDVNGYKNKIVEDNLTLWDSVFTCINTPKLIGPFDGRVTLQYFRKFSGLELVMKRIQDDFLIPYGSLLNEIDHADQFISWLKLGDALITEENRSELLRVLRFFAEQKRSTVGKVIVATDNNKTFFQRNVTKISEIMKDSPEIAAELKTFLLSLYRETFPNQKMIPMEGASGVANMLRILAHTCGIRAEGLLSIFLASRVNGIFFCDGLLGDMKFLLSHGEEFSKTLTPDISEVTFWQWISLYKESKEKKRNVFQVLYATREYFSKLHSTYVVRANEAMFAEVIKHSLEDFIKKYDFFQAHGASIQSGLTAVASSSQEQAVDTGENPIGTAESKVDSASSPVSLVDEGKDQRSDMSNSEFETSLLFTIRQMSSERVSLREKIAHQSQVIEDLTRERDDLQGKLLEVSEDFLGSSRVAKELKTEMNKLKLDLKKQDSRLKQMEKDKKRQEESHASQLQSIETKKQKEAERYQKRIQQKTEALAAEQERSQALTQERDDVLGRVEAARKRTSLLDAQLRESKKNAKSNREESEQAKRESAQAKKETVALREQLSLATKESTKAKEEADSLRHQFEEKAKAAEASEKAFAEREVRFRDAWEARERELNIAVESTQHQTTGELAAEYQQRESALLARIEEMERAMRAQQREYLALQHALKYHRSESLQDRSNGKGPNTQ